MEVCNPGIVVLYSDQQQIHTVLGLQSVSTIVPAVHQGSTPESSYANFVHGWTWYAFGTVLNVWSIGQLHGPGHAQQRQHGLFHHMKADDEHAGVIGDIRLQ